MSIRAGLVYSLLLAIAMAPPAATDDLRSCDSGYGLEICGGIDTDCDGVVDSCDALVVLPPLGHRAVVPGELVSPAGIATDLEGRLIVADASSGRLELRTPDGVFLRVLVEAGDAPDQLSTPGPVAVDATGSIYVVDFGPRAIKKFDAGGNLLGSWRGEDGPYLLVTPLAVAVDGAGRVFVTDSQWDRVSVFDSDGHYLRSWGGSGEAPGQFRSPFDLAIDPDGSVVVVDSSHPSVQRFTPEGVLIGRWGVAGGGPGQMRIPFSLAIDPDGDVWIADLSTLRVQEFDRDGILRQSIALGNSLGYPGAMTLGAFGTIFVADEATGLVRLLPDGAVFSALGRFELAAGDMRMPSDVAIDSAGNRFVFDESGRRVLKFDASGALLHEWVADHFGRTSAFSHLAVDQAGRLYATDVNFNRVVKYDSEGTLLAYWGGMGDGPVPLAVPRGIAIDRDGTVLVVDSSHRSVVRFDPDGVALDAWWTDSFRGYGIAVESGGDILVSDPDSRRIVRYRPTGAFSSAWGEPGSGPGQLVGIQDVATDVRGRTFVPSGDLVQWFDRDGELLGYAALDGGDFRGLGVDANGIVHATERSEGTVWRIGCVQPGHWYVDADGDGYGDPASETSGCGPAPGQVGFGGDCDDARADVHPERVEFCDGRDNDCDAVIDETYIGEALPCLTSMGEASEVSCVAGVPVCAEAPPPVIELEPTVVAAALPPGSDRTVTKTIRIRNAGEATLDWTAEAEAENEGGPPVWLTLSTVTGSTEPGAETGLLLTFVADALAEGTYLAALSVTSNDPIRPLLNVSVTLHAREVPLDALLIDLSPKEPAEAGQVRVTIQPPEPYRAEEIAPETVSAFDGLAPIAGSAEWGDETGDGRRDLSVAFERREFIDSLARFDSVARVVAEIRDLAWLAGERRVRWSRRSVPTSAVPDASAPRPLARRE